MKRALLMIGVWVLLSGHADGAEKTQTQPPMRCHDASKITKHLARKYDEVPVAFGVGSNGKLLQIYASEDNGTWTVVITTAAGVSCVVAAGKGWETLPFRREDRTAASLIYAHEVTTESGAVVDYRGWSQNNGASCCGSGECRPTDWRFNPETQQEEIRVGETWRPIDESKVIGVQPADEGAHVCTAGGSKAPDAKIRCIVRPGFGT